MLKIDYTTWSKEDLESELESLKADLEYLQDSIKGIEEALDEYGNDEDPYCTNCNGTGEVMYDGSSCGCCGGRGFIVNKERYFED